MLSRDISFFLLCLCWTTAQAADCSDPPVSVSKVAWCDYLKRYPFKKQDDPGRRVDVAVKESMGALNADDDTIRSYAFVISIWDYHFPGRNAKELDAIKNEQSNLISFLQEQGFDEAIILQNDEATPDTIRKIFTQYFQTQLYAGSVSGKKIRFMFIFDGHGWRPPNDETTGALALSSLDDENDPDYDHRFSLAELRGLLQDVAPYTQSMIALLGSCYAGSVFTQRPTAEDFIKSPAAWIATATPGWEEAWISPQLRGTVFLRALTTVVRTWHPPVYDMPEDDNSKTVLLGTATPNLRQIVDAINQSHSIGENPATKKPYPPIVTRLIPLTQVSLHIVC